MSFFNSIIIFLSIFSFAFSQTTFNSKIFLKTSITEYPENSEIQLKECLIEEVQLQCKSWRFSVEANNLGPWKRIPEECANYVKDYMNGRGYQFDLDRVSNEAGIYARNVELRGDGKDAWIFDVDETLLSNLPHYAEHGYGSSEDHKKTAPIYKSQKRDEMIEEGYRILGNSGDQWSDLLGSSVSDRSFKLPNPMYYIP
ncbi:unnamed protein product [Fraxinus pennsylvanica]|uniref:Acid phosphatase n=1 Tax=Fraxinus pennsylvanica TaxID=56036 RepID=A0AAD1ZFY1_9LAMI|nr:unnamed protein product [Fraxinus pennsylvanica]